MKIGSPTTKTTRTGQIFPLQIVIKMFAQIAIFVGGLLVGALFIGQFLDATFHTTPWLKFGLFALSSFPAIWIAYRVGRRAIQAANESDPLAEGAQVQA